MIFLQDEISEGYSQDVNMMHLIEYGDNEHILLERELENWTSRDNMVACSSGTAALHLGLEALQVPTSLKRKGAEVIIPDFSMIACARACTLADLVPMPVDCKNDLNISPLMIEKSITKRTVAIMAVHTYGRICDMQTINEIALKYDIPVIEDMAEAHGCYPHPNTQVTTWSFYKNKLVNGEEGGAVCFGSKSLADTARKLRSIGFNDYHDYTHIPRGHNYRMSSVHAALIRRSLKAYHENNDKRIQVEEWYDEYCPDAWKMPKRDSVWVYDFRIKGMDSKLQGSIIDALRGCGIAARHGFKPISSQVEYLSRMKNPQTEIASREVIYLPVTPTTTRNDCQKAFDIVRMWCN